MQEKLIKNLNYLGLTHLKNEIYPMLENAAQQNTPLAEFFSTAISVEATEKRRRSTERRISQAHFPQKKTLESFDWGTPGQRSTRNSCVIFLPSGLPRIIKI